MRTVPKTPPGQYVCGIVLTFSSRKSLTLERNGLTLSLEIEAGVGGLLTENTNFGLGRIDLPNGDISGDAQWGEGYVKPGLSLEYGIAAG